MNEIKKYKEAILRVGSPLERGEFLSNFFGIRNSGCVKMKRNIL
jgi:hypothetical protein